MTYLLILCLYICMLRSFSDAAYNGEYHPIIDYPYLAQLQSTDGQTCGAAILSADWVISAAHCVGDGDHGVITGSSTTGSGGKLTNVTKIFVYGDYRSEDVSNDICLLKLETPLRFNEYQQPILLSRNFPKVGDSVTVAGFGAHHHQLAGSVLRTAQVPIIDDKHCNEVMQKAYYTERDIVKKKFCTSAEEAELCPGDSGGPAVFDNHLIGVLSLGCQYNIPNAFTKIADYDGWIMQITGIKYD